MRFSLNLGLVNPRGSKTWNINDLVAHLVGLMMVITSVIMFLALFSYPCHAFFASIGGWVEVYIGGGIGLGLLGFMPLTQGPDTNYFTTKAKVLGRKVAPWIGLSMILVAVTVVFGPLVFGFGLLNMLPWPDTLVMLMGMMLGIMGLMLVTQCDEN